MQTQAIQAASLYLTTFVICLGSLATIKDRLAPYTLALCAWAAYYFEKTHFLDEVLPALLNINTPIPQWAQADGVMHVLAATSILPILLWRLLRKPIKDKSFLRHSTALLAITALALTTFTFGEVGVRELASEAQSKLLNVTIDAPTNYRQTICEKLDMTCAEIDFGEKSNRTLEENPLLAMVVNAAADTPNARGQMVNGDGDIITFKKNSNGSVIIAFGEKITQHQVKKRVNYNSILLLGTLLISTIWIAVLYFMEVKREKKRLADVKNQINDLVENRAYEFIQG